MKLRLLAMLVLLLLLSILASCGDQGRDQHEATLAALGTTCKLSIPQPLHLVEYVSFKCNERNDALINSAFFVRHYLSFWERDRDELSDGQTIENNAMEQLQSPQPNQLNEQEYAGVAYLTFDDGPGKLTGEVLDILAENEISATFFVLGEQVERYPEIVQRIVAEGHSIGNHTYNHVYDELYSDFINFSDQVFQTMQAIYDVTGEKTRLLRAPGGTYHNVDTSYYDALSEAGFFMFDWNVDSGDSTRRNVSTETIVNNVKEANLTERVIVLMHDSNSHEATVAALPEIITYYREKNYRFDVITTATEPMLSKITDKIRWQRTPATEREQTELIDRVNELMSR